MGTSQVDPAELCNIVWRTLLNYLYAIPIKIHNNNNITLFYRIGHLIALRCPILLSKDVLEREGERGSEYGNEGTKRT